MGYVCKQLASRVEIAHSDLVSYVSAHKSPQTKLKEKITAASKTHAQLLAQAVTARAELWNRTLLLESLVVPGSSAYQTVKLGEQTFKTHDLNDLLMNIQLKVTNTNIPALIGHFNDCFLGEDIHSYCCSATHMEGSNAVDFINALIDGGYIKSIQRGVQHKFSPDVYYQWKKDSVENEDAYYSVQRQVKRLERVYKSAIDKTESLRLQIQLDTTTYMVI